MLSGITDEDFPAVRDRMARAAVRIHRGPVIIGADDEALPIVTWLRRLPVADRVLLTLRYEERLGVTELATILDQPRTKIESRLNGLLAEVPTPAEAYLSYD